jgi:signal transduction histidine kinase
VAIDRALRPVQSLTHRAAEIATGRRRLRLDVTADTTELKELSTELDRLLDALRAAFDREQEFLDDASHELRTPLTIAKTELELALRTARPGPEVRQALESAIEELDRVQATASELLVLARARAAGERGFETVDVRTIADQAAELVRRDRRRCNRRIEVEGSGRALGDEQALERALVNLIGNAVDHATANVRVEITDSQPAGLQITIADDGPGFPDDLLDHLFDRFTRGPDRRAHSTGLGTAIAAEVISTHGGSVDASNAAHGGAVVTIVLPTSTNPNRRPASQPTTRI